MVSLKKLVLFHRGNFLKLELIERNLNENCNSNDKGFFIRILAKTFQHQIFKIKIFYFVRGHHHFILEDTKVFFEHIPFYALLRSTSQKSAEKSKNVLAIKNLYENL